MNSCVIGRIEPSLRDCRLPAETNTVAKLPAPRERLIAPIRAPLIPAGESFELKRAIVLHDAHGREAPCKGKIRAECECHKLGVTCRACHNKKLLNLRDIGDVRLEYADDDGTPAEPVVRLNVVLYRPCDVGDSELHVRQFLPILRDVLESKRKRRVFPPGEHDVLRIVDKVERVSGDLRLEREQPNATRRYFILFDDTRLRKFEHSLHLRQFDTALPVSVIRTGKGELPVKTNIENLTRERAARPYGISPPKRHGGINFPIERTQLLIVRLRECCPREFKRHRCAGEPLTGENDLILELSFNRRIGDSLFDRKDRRFYLRKVHLHSPLQCIAHAIFIRGDRVNNDVCDVLRAVEFRLCPRRHALICVVVDNNADTRLTAAGRQAV
nr:MAG TPA: hypothetical protein [Caudoviricetes sp.]